MQSPSEKNTHNFDSSHSEAGAYVDRLINLMMMRQHDIQSEQIKTIMSYSTLTTCALIKTIAF